MIGYKKERDGTTTQEKIVVRKETRISGYAAAGIITKYNHKKEMNELLLVQRSHNDVWPLEWEIPRGKCAKKDWVDNRTFLQTILVCLKREIREETNLIVEPTMFIDEFMYMFPGNRNTIQFVFLCRMKDPDQEVILSVEHEDYIWVESMMKIQSMNVPKELIVVLSKVFDKEGKIIDHP